MSLTAEMSCTLAASSPAVAQLTVSSLLSGCVVSQHSMQLSEVLRFTVQGISHRCGGQGDSSTTTCTHTEAAVCEKSLSVCQHDLMRWLLSFVVAVRLR